MQLNLIIIILIIIMMMMMIMMIIFNKGAQLATTAVFSGDCSMGPS